MTPISGPAILSNLPNVYSEVYLDKLQHHNIACDFHNGSMGYLANRGTAYQLRANATTSKNDASK